MVLDGSDTHIHIYTHTQTHVLVLGQQVIYDIWVLPLVIPAYVRCMCVCMCVYMCMVCAWCKCVRTVIWVRVVSVDS